MISNWWKRGIFADRVGYLFIAPFFLIYIYFILSSVIQVVFYSFTDFNLFQGKNWVALANYEKVLNDEDFIKSVKNTLLYLVLTLIPNLVLGLGAALLMNTKLVKTYGFRTLLFMPHVISMVAASMMWIWIFDPTHGFLNMALHLFGLERKSWLLDPNYALLSIVLMSVWKAIGYNMIIYLAGLQSIPRDYYEAAEVDGAGIWQSFVHITLPLLSPTTFFLVVTGMIHSFNVFEQVNVMTGGGPTNSTTTVVHQIYIRAFHEFNMGYASAQGVLLLLGVVLVTFINFKFLGSRSRVSMD